MSDSRNQPIKAQLAAQLEAQNLYQRLGLKTNAVDTEKIRRSYLKRCLLLKECAAEIDGETAKAAERLLKEAHDVLCDPSRRQGYDRDLEARTRWRGTPSRRAAAGKQTDANPNHGRYTDLILDRYHLNTPIQEGPRATIHEATDTKFNRPVIIKRVRTERLKSPEYLHGFREEAERFARFTSGHLVKVLDYDACTGALVLEKLQGDLRMLATPKGCDWRTSLDILSDCLLGLSELHAAGTIHSRIDLSHILLDTQGAAKLAVTPGMRGDGKALLPGTQSRYVAPEFLNPAVFGEPGTSADLYSLGFVILELLVGSSFGQRVSAAIGAGTERASEAWLQWHASPTDLLPTIESLVPELPAAYAEILRKMTCKQKDERFQSASDCLQSLRDIESIHAEQAPERIDRPFGGLPESGVDLLGTPAPLHALYQSPAILTWSQILSNPNLIFQKEASRHRLFLMGGASVCAVMLFVLMLAPKREHGDPEADATGIASADSDGSGQDSLDHYSDLLAKQSSPPEESTSPPSADQTDPGSTAQTDRLTTSLQPPDRADLCRVAFQLKPAGELLNVVGNTSEPSSLTPLDRQRNRWDLPSGKYEVRYQIAGSDETSAAEIEVPKGQASMVVVLQTSPVAKSIDSLATAEPLPKFHKRSRARFAFIAPPGVHGKEKEACARNLKGFLAGFSSSGDTELPNLAEEASRDDLHDPRYSFAFALQAQKDGDFELAIAQCRKALSQAKRSQVAFVLPLELLCHLELAHGRKGLQDSVAACRETVRWVHQLENRTGNPEFAAALKDLAWWTGNVIGFIETTRSERAKSCVDLDTCKVLLREELGGTYADLFDGAVQRIEQKYEELLRRKQEHTAASREETTWRQVHKETQRQRAQAIDIPESIFRPSRFQPYSSLATATPEAEERDDRSKYNTEIRKQVSERPQRAYGAPVFTSQFKVYVANDSSLMAQLASETIPDIQSAKYAVR